MKATQATTRGLEEVADIVAALAEQAHAADELNLGEVAHDDLAVDLLDALPVESDPGAATDCPTLIFTAGLVEV